MNVLIKSAKITDPGSPMNGKTTDIFIENGLIRFIRQNIKPEKGVQVIEGNNLHVSPGWFDMQVNFRDPGFEYKEDLTSGMAAAAAGGYTGVMVMPSTNPVVHTKSDVEYVINKSKNIISSVDIYPSGAVTQNIEGKEIAEMYDMHLSGAVAFTDDKHSISNSGVLMRALLYAKNFGGLIITHCDERSISSDGKMNEGPMSTTLGLKGIPALAEELMITRNLHLADYCDARIHITSVSTAHSVELIRKAKAKGLKVTASVNAHHLALEDTLLKDFDTNYKVNPPLRSKVDADALRKGLADGTLDAIISDHCPEDIENKQVEFDHAAFGMSGSETAFAIANSNRGKLTLEELIEKVAINPRRLLNLPTASVKEGDIANITIFDPEMEWKVEEKHIRSKSKNNPMIGRQLKGKPVAVYNRKNLTLIG